ncbi:vWA domain-containing protein [Desulfogranum mediterraneum]|uniref:vWA domain-containing protein n=1 Tax=Desulfogranum mediterraneum TaxID=160661 RepID=UPI000426CC4C|nr:VWA domain-containing protein [Desulfogranum mediterraneum]
MNKKSTIAAIILFTSLSACTETPQTDGEQPVQEEQAKSIRQTPLPPAEPLPAHPEKRKSKDGKQEELISGAILEMSAIPSVVARNAGQMMSQDRVHLSAPGQWNRESYNATDEKGYSSCLHAPLSTFSIDVDTASYANLRRFVTQGTLPPIGAVRIEEMINYFSYDYVQPQGKQAVAIATEVGPSPYHRDYSLVQIKVKAKDMEPTGLPPSNLVFLVDVSGSMNQPNKLGLLKQSMKLLIENLDQDDRVAIVAYAGSDRVVLKPTSGERKETIIAAVNSLQSGGSTHGSQGILTAYQLARQVFMPSGNNRVILASDGDFNVGVTSRGELKKLIATQRDTAIYLTVLGFGMGNYHDDTMELLADSGNGNYAYIDSLLEAKKVLVKEMGGTLFTVAKDAKIQVEFNPALVGAYRLIGYENRALADEDFKNDTKDAGEIGVGHTVTALYEIIPAGHKAVPRIDTLKYQQLQLLSPEKSKDLLTVKLRYKEQGSTVSTEISQSLTMNSKPLAEMSDDFRFAAAVAGFGMLLQDSEHLGTFSWDQCMELIRDARGADREGYRAELLRLVEMSKLLKDNG